MQIGLLRAVRVDAMVIEHTVREDGRIAD
jgi:hypothetical protein